MYIAEDGRPYYVNNDTNESTWDSPLQPILDTIPNSLQEPNSFKNIPNYEQDWKSPLITSVSPSAQNRASFIQDWSQKRRSPTISSLHTTTSSTSRPRLQPQSTTIATCGKDKGFATHAGGVGYADNFWGDRQDGTSGFDVLVLKHRNGKEVCKDMRDFMAQRSRIEEAYAKQLMQLAKNALGDIESGYVNKFTI